jgi:hypothetical protein
MGRFDNRVRVLGRHLGTTPPDGCHQQISVVGNRETLVSQTGYVEAIVVAPYSSETMVARSPFGVFVYDKERAGDVADLLITLAGQIRRGHSS